MLRFWPRFWRALPGTLGVLAFVLAPAAVAALNLAAGLAQIQARDRASATPGSAGETVVVATWDESADGFVLSRRTRTPALAERATP